MDGSETDGVNVVLIAASLVISLIAFSLIRGVVRLYKRQSARRVKNGNAGGHTRAGNAIAEGREKDNGMD